MSLSGLPAHLFTALASPSPDQQDTGDAAKESVDNASFAPSDLIPAGLVLAGAIVVGLLARYVVQRIIDRRSEILGRLAGRFAMFLSVSVGLVYALANIGIRIGPLLGALGIGGFALAFAMRDTLENLISGVILQIRQPFDYDDTVELNGYSGSVTDINLRSVEMTVFSGEHVIIPSKDVLQNPIENWTHNPTKRIDVPVGVSYGVDVERACEVIANGLRDVDGIVDDPPAACVFSGFGASSIDLVAHVWYPSDGPYFDVLRRTAHSVQSSLARNDMDIAFPTRVIVTAETPDDGAEPSNRSEQSPSRPHADRHDGCSSETYAPDGHDEVDDGRGGRQRATASR